MISKIQEIIMKDPIVTVIPAQPGWFSMPTDNESGELFKDASILAWEMIPQIRFDDGDPHYIWDVFPVTSEGRVSEIGEKCLLRPDGHIEEPFIAVWDSLERANSPENCSMRLKAIKRRRDTEMAVKLKK